MPLGTPPPSPSLAVLTFVLLWSVAHSSPAPGPSRPSTQRDSIRSGPPLSARVLRDTAHLPAQIGGIVAAYGVSLVLVAIVLLSLAKRRREHLRGNDLPSYVLQPSFPVADPKLEQFQQQFDFTARPEGHTVPPLTIPKSEYYHAGPYSARVFDTKNGPAPYIVPSPSSSAIPSTIGVSPLVDQSVVAADRAMAQQQLEEMYKYVMEHEEAKQKGIVLESPVASPNPQRESTASDKSKGLLSKKGKAKPSTLNLAAAKEEKSQSKASALFSSLLSPKKKAAKGISISSPIMTPMSGTFPQHESREMSAIPPRHYAPPPPPPIPTDQVPFGAVNTRANGGAPLTPDMSPESVQTIDERIGASLDRANRSRSTLQYAERDPESATSEHSQVPLVGLPSSPKPGSTFPSLPSSPRPGASFSRPNAPSAVRTGGTLPLRAYEEQLGSPFIANQTTKQTVFERTGPLSPSGRTPFTASAVPYSPYQPYTPCVPITPGLVTKEDRRRMKRMVPKTPTMEMVKSSEEIW
ncbi:hypothetical protein Trco_004863 [Trichoderma cornu-damae]|uniref:Uncharacterized protein n=1 Tax=Trichoderma cornu-damae TaxID=654480 RepID=A0A9P8QI09_9HYPO|nr:hypothetical protein Trco_004863 [Trichoderma cornu-damae]